MIRNALLLLALSLFGVVFAADSKPKEPAQDSVPDIYSKPCQRLELQIKYSDDGGIGVAAHVRLERQNDGRFKRETLTKGGYIRGKVPALASQEPAKEDQVRGWLQRLAVIEGACREETTRSEAFDKIASPEPTEEELKAFIQKYGMPESRVELDIRIITTDGTKYHRLEGLERHTQEAAALIEKMSARP